MLSRVWLHTIPHVFSVCGTAEAAATEMCPNAETADALSWKCLETWALLFVSSYILTSDNNDNPKFYFQ